MYYIERNISECREYHSITNLLHFENKIYMARKKVSLEEAIFPVIVKSLSILNSMQFDKDPFNRIKIALLFLKEQFQSKLFCSFEDREKILVRMARLNFYSGYKPI